MIKYITQEDYFKKMKEIHQLPPSQVRANSLILLDQVNRFLSYLFQTDYLKDTEDKIIVNSGWRTEEYNKKIGGAKRSNHITGSAIDINGSKIIDICTKEPHLLIVFDLYAESSEDTVKGKNNPWTHLQICSPKSGLRIFKA